MNKVINMSSCLLQKEVRDERGNLISRICSTKVLNRVPAPKINTSPLLGRV